MLRVQRPRVPRRAATGLGVTAMSDSKTFPLFAPAATIADAIRASAEQRPMQGAYITAITCTRDISAIVDTLRKNRDAARQMAKDAQAAGNGFTYGASMGYAAGVRTAITALENWLNGMPAPAEPDYSHEDQTEREIEEDRAALACRVCDRPAHWGRTRDGVCRQCHEEARRDPSADTEDPSVRGY